MIVNSTSFFLILLEKKMDCNGYIKIQVSTVYQTKIYGTIGDLKIMDMVSFLQDSYSS